MPDALDRTAYELAFDENFTDPALDQPAWRVEDGELRASNMQTGIFSGPLGSAVGQLAFWLVGFEEESPESSGEICVAGLFGNAIEPRRCGVRVGVKAHNDPRLHDDMDEVALELDATDWHTYSAEWTAERIRFFVDDQLVRAVHQRIDYALQAMVDLFEFPTGTDRDPAAYPKVGEVKAVRGYSRPPGRPR